MGCVIMVIMVVIVVGDIDVGVGVRGGSHTFKFKEIEHCLTQQHDEEIPICEVFKNVMIVFFVFIY